MTSVNRTRNSKGTRRLRPATRHDDATANSTKQSTERKLQKARTVLDVMI